MTLENRTSMMAKAIMPALDDLKSRIANTNQKPSQYRMIQMAHIGIIYFSDRWTRHLQYIILPSYYLRII